VFGFFVIDALLITLMLTVQSQLENSQSSLLKWPCVDTATGLTSTITLQPTAILFIVVFGGLQVLQFICSILHQGFNFLQITSTIDLKSDCVRSKDQLTYTDAADETNQVHVDVKAAVNFAKHMQKLSRLERSNDGRQLYTAATTNGHVEGLSYVNRAQSDVIEDPTEGLQTAATAAAAITEVETVNSGHQPALDRAFVAQLVDMENNNPTSESEYRQFESTVQSLRLKGAFRSDTLRQLRQDYNLVSSCRNNPRPRSLSTLFEPPRDYETVNDEGATGGIDVV
jgi:hypothetical protein